jgi:hypothetical protein
MLIFKISNPALHKTTNILPIQAILYVNNCTNFVCNSICTLVAGEMVLSKNHYTHILETGYSFFLKFLFFFIFKGIGHYPVSDFKRICPPW